MMTLFSTLNRAFEQRARYMRTRDEIARLPLDVALDLGLYPGDADHIARRAVYGQ